MAKDPIETHVLDRALESRRGKSVLQGFIAQEAGNPAPPVGSIWLGDSPLTDYAFRTHDRTVWEGEFMTKLLEEPSSTAAKRSAGGPINGKTFSHVIFDEMRSEEEVLAPAGVDTQDAETGSW